MVTTPTESSRTQYELSTVIVFTTGIDLPWLVHVQYPFDIWEASVDECPKTKPYPTRNISVMFQQERTDLFIIQYTIQLPRPR